MFSKVKVRPADLMLLVSAVDAADNALLAASYPAFESWLALSPSQLGTLMMVQTIAGCVTLPLWGGLLPQYGYRFLLSGAISLWAISTLLTTIADNYGAQCILRLINGGSLSCVVPLSQAFLAEETGEGERGKAFGIFSGIEKIAAMIVGYYVVVSGENWRLCYYAVFMITLLLLVIIQSKLPRNAGKRTNKEQSGRQSYVDSLKRILRKPSFAVLVAQGVVGGVPWRAMSFLNLLWLSSGYNRQSTATIGTLSSVGAVLGSILGGVLGDYASKRIGNGTGRIMVAQTGVIAGIPLWVVWLRIENNVVFSIILGFLFYLFAAWPNTGANRPICAELVRNTQDRANIVAFWIFLEGVSASIVGGPVLGAVSEFYGYKLDSGSNNALALRTALNNIGIVAWVLCFVCWCAMYWTYPRDRERVQNFSGTLNKAQKSEP